MRILIKFPTRGRPQQFTKTLNGWISYAAQPQLLSVLVSYDEDDATMTPDVIGFAEKMHPSVLCVRGKSESKIHACNRDLPEYGGDWDVVLLVSDDMWCVRQGWDAMIRDNMLKYFPDTDGALWFYDGAQNRINTLECVGRRRWESNDRTIYRREYRSFFCDNESTAVGLRDKKLVLLQQSIAHHQHPAWLGGMKPDATYKRNNPHWAHDQAVFNRRQAEGFPK